MNDAESIIKLSETWKTAATLLSFEIEAPYQLKNNDGEEIMCVAYLANFGGPKGMVIGFAQSPGLKTDKVLLSVAKSKGLFCSFINARAYQIFNEKLYKETLFDWGFFGDLALRPKWLENYS